MKLTCACVKSSAHAHGTKTRGGNFKQFNGNGRFTTDLQGRLRTSDGDQRTGTFLQMRVTAVSKVKVGVLRPVQQPVLRCERGIIF